MQDGIMVSVIVLTYNHEKYIRQALDSILMQEIDFKIEILVGDDCSTDGTPEILLEYQSKYPDIFCIRLRKMNVGATKNLYELLMLARGKYIAYLEGDDYWIDDAKLQKQYICLDANHEYVACTHDCIIVDENSQIRSDARFAEEYNFWVFRKDFFGFNDFKKWRLPGQIATLMHKNIFLNSDEDFTIIYKAHRMVGDRTLILILLQFGKIAHTNYLGSAYRYIEDKNGTNWCSVYHNKINGVEDDFWLFSKLDIYSETKFGEKFSSDILQYDLMFRALENVLKKPSIKGCKLCCMILFSQENKIKVLKHSIKRLLISYLR